MRTIFRKTNKNLYPLVRTRKCTYQAVRDVSFSENCAYLHEICNRDYYEEEKKELNPLFVELTWEIAQNNLRAKLSCHTKTTISLLPKISPLYLTSIRRSHDIQGVIYDNLTNNQLRLCIYWVARNPAKFNKRVLPSASKRITIVIIPII